MEIQVFKVQLAVAGSSGIDGGFYLLDDGISFPEKIGDCIGDLGPEVDDA